MATVLVIDDEEVITSVVSLALTMAEHRVLTCNQPERAFASAVAEPVDVIILDVKMPGMSGFDVLDELRSDERTASVPVLFLSGLSGDQDRVRGLRQGGDDYLAKPFVAEELVLRVERLAQTRKRTPIRQALRELEERLQQRKTIRGICLGRYQLLEVLGKGAMGIVLRGWDPKLRRHVALKTVRFATMPSLDCKEPVSTLLREAINAAQLNHPNVVAVYDMDEEPGTAFVAMEYVDGVSLWNYLSYKRTILDADQVIPLGSAIARGLDAAHRSDLLHHDVKTSNVLLGRDGSIKVTDFGLARFRSSMVESPDKVFGTPGYLPPETLQGKGYDQTGDLFGLGVILYDCLTGDLPFQAPSVFITAERTIHKHPDPPSAKNPSVNGDLDELIMSLMSKQPEQRPQSAMDVIRSFEALGADREHFWEPDVEAFERPKHGERQPAEVESSVMSVVKTGGG